MYRDVRILMDMLAVTLRAFCEVGAGCRDSAAVIAVPDRDTDAPNQSWREMHQSWMFDSHWIYVFEKRSGTNLVLPEVTASIAGPASGFILTNHCLVVIGSTMVLQREQ